MLRLAAIFALSCTAKSHLRQLPGASDVEVVEKKSSAVFKKVAEQMRLVADELQKGTTNKNAKHPMAAKKDEKFPWWANASAAGSTPNLTHVKTQKAPKDSKSEEKLPWWANASAGNMPNLTQTKTKNVSKDSIKDEKFPWWANASAGNMPNLTQTKTEKVARKDKKFPWWVNASAGELPNFTQITKDLPQDLPKGQPTFADLGPFESKEAACDYCFTSHTRSSVVKNCICTAYDADDGPTMFCTASAAGVKWVASKGGCKCVEKNPAKMGQTTCDPF